MRLVTGLERDDVTHHDLSNIVLKFGNDEFGKRQHALQALVPVNDEDLVGMVRERIEAPQIPRDGLDRGVLAHADHVEIHEGADRILGVRHRRAQLLAFIDGQGLEDIVDNSFGEVRRQVGDLVGLQLLGRSDQLLQIHAADESLAHRIGSLEQDFAVALRFDEIPDDEPLLQRQRFEHVRDVGRMHGVELRAKFGDVLPMHERFHQLVLWHFLALHQVLDQAVPPQELLNLTQVGLEVFELLLRAEGFDHARRPFAVKWSPGLPRTTPDAPRAAEAILAVGCMMGDRKISPDGTPYSPLRLT